MIVWTGFFKEDQDSRRKPDKDTERDRVQREGEES